MDIKAGELPRRIGGWSLGAITVGIVIGSGVFRTPSDIAALVGSPLNVMLVWLAGGLVTMCLALSLAELASMFPQSGGLYTYLREAFGNRSAFLFGWTFLLINPANWAAVSLIFASYFAIVFPGTAGHAKLIASAAILCVCAVNIVSTRLSTRFNWVFTLVKGAALLGLSVGILVVTRDGIPTGSAVQSLSIGHWGVALVAVLWPFEGVAAAAAMAGEVRNPRRNLPLGLIGGTIFVLLVYLLVNAALLSALSIDAMAKSESVFFDAATVTMGELGGLAIALAALAATFGALTAGATCDPRVLFAMATDKLFFARTGDVHRRFQTPYIAIIVSGTLAIIYIWVRTFEELASQFVLGMWVFYAWCVLGLIRLRRKRPELERPYRAPLYPILPMLFVLASGWLLINSFVELPVTSMINVAVILTGIPVYELWRWLGGRSRGCATPSTPESAGPS